MEETKGEEKERNSCRHEECYCPVCSLGRFAGATRRKYSSFFDHVDNARIEVLRAFRALVDERISTIEKRKASAEKKAGATKIEVE